MKAVVALFALCTLLPGRTQPALAEDGSAPKAPAPAAPSAGGAASQPPVRVNPAAPAAGTHQKEEDVTPPEPEEVPDAADPYARDPYENEPSGDEGAVDDARPKLDEPSVGTAPEPDLPEAADGDDTQPDDAAEE